MDEKKKNRFVEFIKKYWKAILSVFLLLSTLFFLLLKNVSQDNSWDIAFDIAATLTITVNLSLSISVNNHYKSINNRVDKIDNQYNVQNLIQGGKTLKDFDNEVLVKNIHLIIEGIKKINNDIFNLVVLYALEGDNVDKKIVNNYYNKVQELIDEIELKIINNKSLNNMIKEYINIARDSLVDISMLSSKYLSFRDSLMNLSKNHTNLEQKRILIIDKFRSLIEENYSPIQ